MKSASIRLIFIIAVTPVHAIAAEKHGGYIGGAIGRTDLELSSKSKSQIGSSFDGTDVGFKLFSGYRINDFFALEVSGRPHEWLGFSH